MGSLLLERDTQLGQLTECLRSAETGHGQLILISGEAGIGKSALVDTFCNELRNVRRVLIGLCDPLSTPRPLGPLVDISLELGSRLAMLLGSSEKPTFVFAEALN